MCKPCQERWRIILAQQSKLEIMKEDSKKEKDSTTKVEAPVETGRPDIDKIIADRRKAVELGKIVNK